MKKEKSEKYLDQKKIVKMINKALKVGAQLPEGAHRNAMLGTLDALLEEAKKPLSSPRGKTVLH